MYGPMFDGAWMHSAGLPMMFVYLAVVVVGFAALAWAVIRGVERTVAHRDVALDEIRRRYAAGEIDNDEFEARRRRLTAS